MILTLVNAAVISNEFVILFENIDEIYLNLSLLRRACPCANCQGEPDALGRVLRPALNYGPRAFELSNFEQIGGYAIQFFWGDGHSTGIYSYSYLRKLVRLP